MRIRIPVEVGLSVLLIGMSIRIVGYSVAAAQQGSSQGNNATLPEVPKAPVTYPEIERQLPEGIPALNLARGKKSAAYTAHDVRKFLVSRPGPYGVKGIPKVKINRIDCTLVAGKVQGILRGKTTGLPDDFRVCYAELSGIFTFLGPPSPRSPHGTTVTYHRAFRVFDAKTGNIMLFGGFD